MSEPKVMPRWIPLVGGVLGSTTCGALLYAYSVFVKPLQAEFGWGRADTILAFAIACLVFGLTTFPAGRLSDKYGPKKVVLTGGVILGIGLVMTAFIQTKIQLYICYGVVASFGGGLIYLPPIATVPKWWPDRKALATGFAVVGLGLGSFIMAPLATWIIENYGWRMVFITTGIGMSLMAIVSAFCLKVPPVGWLPEGFRPAESSGDSQDAQCRDYTFSETYKSLPFWMLYFAFFCGAFAGLMVIGNIAAHAKDQGLTAYMASWAASFLGVANAVVRIAIGGVADRIGSKKTFVGVFVLQSMAMVLLFPSAQVFWFIWIVAAAIGWNYGAMFTLFPSTCINFFGQKNHGSNYGLLFTSWGLAGFAGNYVGGWLQDTTGTYFAPFLIGAILVVVSAVLVGLVKPPQKHENNAVEVIVPIIGTEDNCSTHA